MNVILIQNEKKIMMVHREEIQMEILLLYLLRYIVKEINLRGFPILIFEKNNKNKE